MEKEGDIEAHSCSLPNVENELKDVLLCSNRLAKQITTVKQKLLADELILRDFESCFRLDRKFKQLAACESEMSELNLSFSELNEGLLQRKANSMEAEDKDNLINQYKTRLTIVQRDIETLLEHSILESKTVPPKMISLLNRLEMSMFRVALKISTVQKDFKDASQQFASIEIRDCTFLRSSDVVVTDKKNRRLLIFSSDTTFKKEVPLDEMPFSVVEINSSKVAVSFPNTWCVKTINVLNNNVIDVFELGGPCTGISVYENRLAVRVENSGCHILDTTTGDTYKIVHIDDEFSSYVALRDNSLYFTNWKTDKVVCMALDGELKWEFKNGNLKTPNGIVADAHGNAFVAGYSSGNIFFVTKDGLNLKQISIKDETNSTDLSASIREKRNPIGIDINTNNELLVCSITGFSICKINTSVSL